VLAAVMAVLVGSAEGARRVSFDTDILSLLPRDGHAIPAFRHFLGSFGSVDQLYVVFTAPEGHSVSEYSDRVDEWVHRLRDAPEIARVDAGVADETRNFDWLIARELLLLRGQRLDQALERLRPEGLKAAIASRRELLAMPSPELGALVQNDPAGLADLVSDGLADIAPGLNARVAVRGYVSQDDRRRLVIAQPRRPPYDTAFSRALDTRLREIGASIDSPGGAHPSDSLDESLPPLAIEFAGGHRIALETEAVVRRESILNGVESLALILPLLFLTFRSAWLVMVGPLPSALSLFVAIGALGFSSATLSSAAAGSAAMLFGLGVDGVVLIYVAYSLEAPLAGPSASMLLGMWTTAATFYGLAFVDFPSLQQLGVLIGHSMMACSVLTLVIVPALLPRRRPRHLATLTMPALATWVDGHRRIILAAAAAATVMSVLAARQLHINPTLERLRSVTPAAQLETRLASIFGLPSDLYVIFADGPNLEPLLEANERMSARASIDMPELQLLAPTRLLPSMTAQEQTAQRMRDAHLSVPAIRASLETAGEAAGFRRGVFEPFARRLPQLLDSSQRLTYDGYRANGLGDLIGRFVARDGNMWRLATYFSPTGEPQLERLQRIVDGVDPAQTITGLPLVNRELAAQFLPDFLKGLTIGTVIVIALVGLAFRQWRLSLYALAPTVIGLIWAAGLLAAAHVELDLFALFAVVTFVGIGVDYGIHLVHRFQERGDAQRAVAELAPVILVAAAITLFGYGTLLTSSYPPLRSIGLVSIVSVATLAVTSIFVLPALLMGKRS
jgi:predicted RND superfamily exporter protein